MNPEFCWESEVSGLSPKISCDSEVKGRAQNFAAHTFAVQPPPYAPPAGTPHPEGTRGGHGGERRGRDPPPREPGPSGVEKPGRKGGGLHNKTEANLL